MGFMLTKDQVIEPLVKLRNDEVVVTTMAMVRPWGRLSSHPLDLASGDSAMGHAADFALGIALAQPERKVICLNGDGSMLMSLGTLVTIVQSSAKNLYLFIIENSTYEITGNQPVPGAGRVDFAAMAKAAGFPHAFTFSEASRYEESLPKVLRLEGPVLIDIKVEPGREGPLSRREEEEALYLKTSLADSARQLREALSRSGKNA